jgi:hypothetical protein
MELLNYEKYKNKVINEITINEPLITNSTAKSGFNDLKFMDGL